MTSTTNISLEAERLCQKYRLDSNTQELLIESIQQQIKAEEERVQREAQERAKEEMREIYANTQTREVLLGQHSASKDSSRVSDKPLSNIFVMEKRRSVPDNILGDRQKENKQLMNKTSQ